MDNEPNRLKKIERDENNLIKGLNYTFDESGRVLWRKLIKNEYLVPNKDRTKETDISKLEDKDILVLLAGVKDIADCRGYNSVRFNIINSSPEFCCCSCEIDWIGNYEVENRPISFESTADATLNNTSSINGKYFLTTTAENRAFIRCVKNFLRISLLGKDEIPADKTLSIGNEVSSGPSKQIQLLTELMAKKNVNFDHIVIRLKKDNQYNESYKSLNDLPNDIIFNLLDRLKSYNPT